MPNPIAGVVLSRAFSDCTDIHLLLINRPIRHIASLFIYEKLLASDILLSLARMALPESHMYD